MSKMFRLVLAVASLTVATRPPVLLVWPVLVWSAPASAQAAKDDSATPKPVPLTQKVVDSLIAAQPEIANLQAKSQAGDPAQSDPKMQPRLEDVAKKHGFADFAAYEAAADTVGLVLSGIDPDSKTYVGPAAIIEKQMKLVEADTSLPAKDKAQTLKEMREAIANATTNKPPPETVALVTKNYDKLADGFQTGGE